MSIPLFILALLLLLAQELLKKFFKLEEYSKKAKELSDKIKKEGFSDELIKEFVKIQKVLNTYFLASLFVFLSVLFIIKGVFSNASYILHNDTIIIKGYGIAYYIDGKIYYSNIIKDSNVVKKVINKETKIVPVYTITPFKIPILNRNWLGAIGTFFIYYFALSILFNIVKNILMKYGIWVKE